MTCESLKRVPPAHRRTLPGLSGVPRPARGELLHQHRPDDERHLRLHLDAHQRPPRRSTEPCGGGLRPRPADLPARGVRRVQGRRAKTPPEFHSQIDLIKDIVTAMGIAVVTKEGFEADDALATMTRIGTEAGAPVEVMSGDKDSFQLASETVTILYPKRGVSDLNRMTPEAV